MVCAACAMYLQMNWNDWVYHINVDERDLLLWPILLGWWKRIPENASRKKIQFLSFSVFRFKHKCSSIYTLQIYIVTSFISMVSCWFDFCAHIKSFLSFQLRLLNKIHFIYLYGCEAAFMYIVQAMASKHKMVDLCAGPRMGEEACVYVMVKIAYALYVVFVCWQPRRVCAKNLLENVSI